MGDKSKIEWTDATWNPVTGCTKVSAGCKNCYAERLFPRPYPGRKFTDVQCHPERLDLPSRWRKPRRIFVNSMSDLFHEAVPDEFIAKVFREMSAAKQHQFQVLTKRPERMQQFCSRVRQSRSGYITHDGTDPSKAFVGTGEIVAGQSGWPIPNVWLGVSCEDQKTADERIQLLLQTPAAVRFVSCEPLLGAVDIEKWMWPTCWHWEAPYKSPEEAIAAGAYAEKKRQALVSADWKFIDWVIVGGESGPNARPMHPDWARSLRDQCLAASVPFFFKQWGEWLSEFTDEQVRTIRAGKIKWQFEDGVLSYKVGKHVAGRMLDGKEYNQYPEPS